MALMATDGQAANFSIQLIIGSLKFCVLLIAYGLDDQLLAVVGIAVATALGYGFGIYVVLHRLSKYTAVGTDG
jgi:hypothetical protein